MADDLQEPNSENINDESGIKWAWAVIFVVMTLTNLIVEHDTPIYHLGHSIAATTIGFVCSPLVFLVMKRFSKFRWMWYHWFNIATSAGFGLDILRWIIVHLAKSSIQ
jgi:hypothetical protein